MQAPAKPANEAERLAALATFDILDSPVEASFDSIARVVALVLQVPIALISIVDADRQWFKARYGLAATETPREISFCGHVVAEAVPLVVPDATLDARFADNPLVEGDPAIRFYAGVPLTTPDGFVLGTLCAIDRVPRALSLEQHEALRRLAEQVVALLELRRTARLLREQRQALVERELALADRERQLATVFDAMVEGVIVQGPAGAVLQHNRAAAEILGLTTEQIQRAAPIPPGWQALKLDGQPVTADDHPAAVTMRTGAPQSDVLLQIIHGDGGRRWVNVHTRPLREPGAQLPYAVLATFHDVTRQREQDARVALDQRLVTAGTLAAGVGHEINNPLLYVFANISLAIEELEDLAAGPASARLADIIGLLRAAHEGADRVKRIVRGLKSLARADSDLVLIDVNAVVRDAMQMASFELRTSATAELDLDTVAPVHGDESRLAQVLINLLVNAGHAFAERDPARNHVVVRTHAAGDRVVIEVTDNGPGIAPEVVPRIFDPFFTTKPVGAGAGLGLALAHGIVTALGGELTCETQLGRGTTFRISFPTATPVTTAPVAGPFGRIAAAGGRIAIIDDEPAILASLGRVFRREYEVATFVDPRVVLAEIEAGTRFDVLFCDLSMPYLSGMELYERICAVSPDLAARVVFISGDVTREEIRRFLTTVPNERIEKPVSIGALRALVHRLLPPA